MQFYLAPLDGITDFYYRQVFHREHGKDIDKYFTAFLPTTLNMEKNQKEGKEVLPDNNRGMPLIPQTLTNSADDCLRFLRTITGAGYREVNLNIGCPSGTVMGKGRGAGFLDQLDELDAFFYYLFSARELPTDLKISVKTRIGKRDPEEFSKILEIYNRYPISELIVHPRTGKQHYSGTVNGDAFLYAMKTSRIPLVYNGDLFTIRHYKAWEEQMKRAEGIKPHAVMIGRGLIANPALLREIKGGPQLTEDELRRYLNGLRDILADSFNEKTVLGRMKEIWFYVRYLFPLETEKTRQIMRLTTLEELNILQEEVLERFEENTKREEIPDERNIQM